MTAQGNSNSRTLFAGISSLALSVSFVGEALAQELASPPEELVAEEIVVTATRRNEALKDVPISLNAFDAERLEDSGVGDLEDLQFLAAGMQVTNERGLTKVTLRGVGTKQIGLGVDSGVAVHRDGVYLANRYDMGLGFFDLSRIEVLRGPQGTLYGRNATGGAINIITNEPTAHPSAGGRVTIGNYDLVAVEGFASGPLPFEGVTGRIAFLTRQSDGYTPNIFNGQSLDNADLAAVRGTLRIEPTDTLNVNLTADYARDDGVGAFIYSRGFAGAPLTGELQGSIIPPGRAVNYDTPGIQDKEAWGLTARAEWSLPSSKLVSLTAYREFKLNESFDSDGTSQTILFLFPATFAARQFSQEFSLASTAVGPWSWLVGANFFWENAQSFTVVELPTIPLTIDIRVPSLETKAYAVFGEVSYALTDRLSMTAGARVGYDEKSVESVTIINGAATSPPPLEDNWTSFSPKVALTYEFSQSITGYATIGRGFKAGGYNGGAQDQRSFAPEEVTNYEVGLKTSMYDGRVRGYLAIYYMDYTNLQVPVLRTNPATGFVQGTIDNAATAEIKGVEFELIAAPTPAFSFDIVGAYTDARFEEWVDAADSVRGNASFDVSGNRLPDVPKWALTVGANYRVFTLPGLGELAVRAEYAFKSKVYFTPFERDIEAEGSFGIWNARVKLEDAGSRWSLAAWVKNMTDETAASNRFQSPNGITGRPTIAALYPPRTYGVTLGYEF